MVSYVKDPNLVAILKYEDDPSILAIQSNCKNRIKFAFEVIDLASIKKLITWKWIKHFRNARSDMPTKIIKENVDTFAEFLWKSIN